MNKRDNNLKIQSLSHGRWAHHHGMGTEGAWLTTEPVSGPSVPVMGSEMVQLHTRDPREAASQYCSVVLLEIRNNKTRQQTHHVGEARVLLRGQGLKAECQGSPCCR